jgi:hypothetical protein
MYLNNFIVQIHVLFNEHKKLFVVYIPNRRECKICYNVWAFWSFHVDGGYPIIIWLT